MNNELGSVWKCGTPVYSSQIAILNHLKRNVDDSQMDEMWYSIFWQTHIKLIKHIFLMGSGDDYQPTKIPIEAVGRTRANVRMYPNTGNGQ